MSTKRTHDDEQIFYYCSFTCYRWMPLIEIVKGYDLVYKWFNDLHQMQCFVCVYIIMPNNIHMILYFPHKGYNLNTILGNGKRFIAYEIVKRLKRDSNTEILNLLSAELTLRDKRKGQLHKVFQPSFDAKGIYKEWFFHQKVLYIHLNPVRGKWALVQDYTDYEHSSASFYERNEVKHFLPFDYRQIFR